MRIQAMCSHEVKARPMRNVWNIKRARTKIANIRVKKQDSPMSISNRVSLLNSRLCSSTFSTKYFMPKLIAMIICKN